jgi:methylated-DNA-[protein]-cysteine S-methyltransferase
MKRLTSFQKKVYTVVKKIPRGQVRTYAWVAQKIKKPKAVRAIGTALKKNPFTIIVPCHRVVHSDGSLGEYALGRDLKRKLLEIEHVGRDKRKTKRIAKKTFRT